MRNLIAILFASSLLGSINVATAANTDKDMPTPPVQRAEPPTETPTPGGKPDYLEKQPSSNGQEAVKPGSEKNSNMKKMEKGKSHNKQPESGGVEVK